MRCLIIGTNQQSTSIFLRYIIGGNYESNPNIYLKINNSNEEELIKDKKIYVGRNQEIISRERKKITLKLQTPYICRDAVGIEFIDSNSQNYSDYDNIELIKSADYVIYLYSGKRDYSQYQIYNNNIISVLMPENHNTGFTALENTKLILPGKNFILGYGDHPIKIIKYMNRRYELLCLKKECELLRYRLKDNERQCEIAIVAYFIIFILIFICLFK